MGGWEDGRTERRGRRTKERGAGVGSEEAREDRMARGVRREGGQHWGRQEDTAGQAVHGALGRVQGFA